MEWYIKHALHPSPHLQPHTQNSCYPSQARQRPWLSAEHGFTTTISPRVIHHYTTKTLRFSQAYDLDSDALQLSPTPLGSARRRKASSSSAETSNAISLTHFSHQKQPRLPYHNNSLIVNTGFQELLNQQVPSFKAGVFTYRYKAHWRIRAAGISLTHNERPTPTG